MLDCPKELLAERERRIALYIRRAERRVNLFTGRHDVSPVNFNYQIVAPSKMPWLTLVDTIIGDDQPQPESYETLDQCINRIPSFFEDFAPLMFPEDMNLPKFKIRFSYGNEKDTFFCKRAIFKLFENHPSVAICGKVFVGEKYIGQINANLIGIKELHKTN